MPLEHLVTAVNGASIQVSSNSGVKILVATSYESMLPDDVRYIYDVFAIFRSMQLQRLENEGRNFSCLTIPKRKTNSFFGIFRTHSLANCSQLSVGHAIFLVK